MGELFLFLKKGKGKTSSYLSSAGEKYMRRIYEKATHTDSTTIRRIEIVNLSGRST